MLVRVLGARSRRWIVASTLGLGVAGAVLVTVGQSHRTFADLSGAAQSLMSVLLPLTGVLLVQDLRRAPGQYRLESTLLTALALATGVALLGAAVCAVVLGVAGSGDAGDPWAGAPAIVLGSVLVQGVAQLVGTGFGLLLRRSLIAFLATIVVPLSIWLLLGVVDVLQPAQAWLAPFPSVRNLLSGQMSPMAWAQWFVVATLWGAGLNIAGAVRLRASPVHSGQ